MMADRHTTPSALALFALSAPALAMPREHFPNNFPSTWLHGGKSVFPSRIVGGVDAERGEFKFYVSYEEAETGEQAGFQFCGASLINPVWALTAAHCTGGNNQVRVSAYDRTFDEVTEEIRPLTQQIDFPQYDPIKIEYYINSYVAMLGWQEPITTVPQIALSNTDTFKKNPQLITVIGLGTLKEGGAPASVLQKVFLPFVSDEDCAKAYAGQGVDFDPATMFCSGEGGKDACQGDSGGPFFFTEDSVQKQIGVVSWGIGGARPDFPGIGASLNKKVLEFIELLIDEGELKKLKVAEL